MGIFSRLLSEMSHDFKPGDEVETKHHGSGVVHALDGKHNLIVKVKDKHYQVPHNQIERAKECCS